MKPLLCIAHRGGPHFVQSSLPENSLAAISRSLELGVYAIEIDIFHIGGELLVTHDRRLGRVVSGEGIITEQPLSYLREQRLGNGEPVPTLQEVLELVGDKALLNIEIKGAHSVPALARALNDYVANHHGTFEQYIVSSFDHQQLYQCLQQLPQVKRGVLIEGIPLDYAACCEPLNAYAFNTHLGFLSPELIQDAQRRGFKNWVYTVNHEDDWRTLAALGVDAVFTDKPDMLMFYNQHHL